MPGRLAWGYYPTNKVWLPIQVDANGRIKADMSAINLNDLADVSVPSPTDGDFFYYDAGTGLWKSKAHADLVTGVHGVGVHGILAATRQALTYYVDAGSGDDDNDGSQSYPKATILGALNALPVVIAHAATIKVRPGNYPENNTGIEFGRFNTLEYISIVAVNDNDENMYDYGKATGGGNNYLDDSGKSWSTDQFTDAYIWISAGTGAGQRRQVSSNTATRITVTANWTTNPDNTSVYSIGGGPVVTGTGSTHFIIDGKKINVYGFQHTGATVYDTYYLNGAMGTYYYNYSNSNVRGLGTTYGVSGVYAYYNYFDTSTQGYVILNHSYTEARRNVVVNPTYGFLVDYASIALMQGGDNANYIKDCTTGIYIGPGSGCIYASVQQFSGCGSNIDPAVSTTVPRWWS